MLKRFASKFVCASAMVATVAVTGVAEAGWRGWNIHTPDYPVSKAMEFFAKEAEARTDGRVDGKVYHSAVLGSQQDAIEQMQIGAIDFAGFNLGPLGNSVPEVNVVSLPFVFKDMEHMHRVMDGEVGKDLSDAMSKEGIIALAWYDSGARSFYTTSKPINTPADVTGLKFRVMNNELYVGMVEALNGNATPMAYSEVYQALKTGVVDGAENNWPSYESSNHFEVAGYYSATQHLIIPECLCVSVKAWDKLSADDQKAVRAAAVESAELQRKLWAERSEKSRAAVEKAGIKFNPIADKSAFQNAMTPVYESAYKSNPALKSLVEKIRSVD